MSYEAQSEQIVTRLVAASLADEPTLAQAFEVLEHATAACVRATERVQSLAPPTRPIQCDQGCAWCCTMRVAVTPLEVLRIADYLRGQQTDEGLAALQARLIQTLVHTHDLTWRQHVRLSLPCPLLRDNLCSVHPVRPFVCRSHNSLDVKCCEEFSRVPTEMMVPMYRPQQDITNGTARGLSAGLTAAGLDGEYRELVSTLLTALETPDAGERWLAGEPVF
jgi:Fe-S-cluster containining protein